MKTYGFLINTNVIEIQAQDEHSALLKLVNEHFDQISEHGEIDLLGEMLPQSDRIITIHWDFTDGTEVSYIEGLSRNDSFSTNCVQFFSLEQDCEVIVINSKGERISKNNIQEHSPKQIQPAHNITKLLLADRLIWKK